MVPPKRPPQAPPLAAIVGPTGSGKTELALALARRLPVEIVVADSRQVYRGMDVGTAKPDAGARAIAAHHLIDLVEPDERFSVADWVAAARTAIAEIAERGRMPLLVAGTGLYLDALVDGFDFASQAWAPQTRRRLADELEAEGLDVLVARLAASDPATAARIDLRNPRRVLRALERAELSAGPSRPTASPYRGRVGMIGIRRPREVLYARIDARAHRIFADGLLPEVEALLAAGHGTDLGPMSGHGYREAARVAAGEWSLEDAIATTARRTRQYAKRQLNWFRRDPRIVWLSAGAAPADEPAFVDEAQLILRRLLA